MKKRNSNPEGDARVLKRINENAPTREQMVAYVKACGALEPERRNFEVHVITWAQLFPDNMAQGESAVFRMEALARMASEDPLPGWTEPMGDGGLLTHEAIFAAAATEPVIMKDGEVTFDREALIRRAFQFARRAGA
jgi:hypothetical protein